MKKNTSFTALMASNPDTAQECFGLAVGDAYCKLCGDNQVLLGMNIPDESYGDDDAENVARKAIELNTENRSIRL